jgi:O-antigen ligase
VNEMLLWAGAVAALLVLSRPEGPPLGARFVIGLLVALHGLAWVDWAVKLRVLPLTTIQDPWFVGQERLRFESFAGWLINRNHWAALGIVLWPVALGWGLLGASRRRRALGWLGAAAVVTSVLATRSRAGLLVVIAQSITLGVFFVVTARGRTRLLVGAAMVAAVSVAASQLGRWTARIGADDVADRAGIYVATARMALDSPVVGFGMGTFRAAFPAYQPASALYSYSHAHNDPLEWWAGGGVFGLVLVLGLAWATVRGARNRRASSRARLLWTLAVAGGAMAACVEFPLQIPAVRFVWLGVLFAGPSRPRRETSERAV